MNNLASTKRRQIWRLKLQQASRAARFLVPKIPSLRAIALTGSVAFGDVTSGDDLDFLILTAANRVYTVRFWSYFYALKRGRLRRPGQQKDRWCLNLFLAQDHLIIPSRKRTPFAARQLARLVPLYDPDNLFKRLQTENQFWTQNLGASYRQEDLPFDPYLSAVPRRPQNQSPAWRLLGDGIEVVWRWSQRLYLTPKLTREVINRHQIFFHPLERC